jgi:hypothetical protein
MVPRSRINSLQVTVLISIAVLACIDLGCTSSSRLTNMWKDPSFENTPMTNVLIIAAKRDPVKRRMWEDGFVAELSAHSVAATPSYRLFANAVPDTEQVAAAVREKKFDGMIFVRNLPTVTSTRYVPGYVQSELVTHYSGWTQKYHSVYRDVVHPGYTDSDRVVRQEINVWTTKEAGYLVWAATGETLDPSSGEAVRDEITGLIVPELEHQGIIPAK